MSEITVVGKIEQLTGAAPASVMPTLTGSSAFIVANAELAKALGERDARIAELEKDIAEKTGLIAALQRSNDRLRQKIDRLSS